MSPRKAATPTRRVAASAARGVSWMSLLAATTLGITGVDQVRTLVRGAGNHWTAGNLRLIVQSYRKGSMVGEGLLPQDYAQPLASSQRAITPEELKEGVVVRMLQLPAEGDAESVLVAWVEHGLPNLELDAMEARPNAGSYYGVARRTDGEILLGPLTG